MFLAGPRTEHQPHDNLMGAKIVSRTGLFKDGDPLDLFKAGYPPSASAVRVRHPAGADGSAKARSADSAARRQRISAHFGLGRAGEGAQVPCQPQMAVGAETLALLCPRWLIAYDSLQKLTSSSTEPV